MAASFPSLRLPVAPTVAKLKAHDGGDLDAPPCDGSGLVHVASGVDPAGEPHVWRRSRGGASLGCGSARPRRGRHRRRIR
jgi:hypothetical protein